MPQGGLSLAFRGTMVDRRYQVFYRRTEMICLLYTSDAADERSSVDLGGRRIIKKKKDKYLGGGMIQSE